MTAITPPRRLPLSGSERIVFAGLLLVVGGFAVVPLARLAYEGLGSGPLSAVLAARSTWIAAQHTVVSGIFGTAISLAIGVPAALLIALTDLRAKSLLVFAFMLPLLIPPQVIAIAWIELLGPASPLLAPIGLAPPTGAPHPLFGAAGVSLLLGIEHAPLVFLSVNAGLRALPRGLVEAAQAAGAGRGRVLRDVILPLARPSIIAGAALAFVSSIGNFGTPALLGIPGGYTVLTTLIYQKLAGFGPKVLAEVADLALVLGVIAAAGLALQGRIERDGYGRAASPGTPPLDVALGPMRPVVEAICWAVVLAIAVLPLIALGASSLVPAYGVRLTAATLTFENYRYIVFEHDAAARAARNSIFLAATAAAILAALALPLGLFIAWRRSRIMRLVGAAAELPYALPGVVLAIACILIFIQRIPGLGTSLYNTIWILLAAYLARFLPLMLRPVTAGFRQLERSVEEAAQSCGAGFVRRLRQVVLPLLGPAVGAGAVLVFLTALNELTLSILLWSTGNETLGVVVFSLEQGGDNLSAAALAVLTVIVTVGVMALAGRLMRGLPRGVLPWQV